SVLPCDPAAFLSCSNIFLVRPRGVDRTGPHCLASGLLSDPTEFHPFFFNPRARIVSRGEHALASAVVRRIGVCCRYLPSGKHARSGLLALTAAEYSLARLDRNSSTRLLHPLSGTDSSADAIFLVS